MLYTSIKQAENGLFFLLFESEVINMFVRRSRSEWRRANSRNVSLDTLYGGQFTLSTQFILIFSPYWRSTVVPLETYPLHSYHIIRPLAVLIKD